jgi:outer membrane lipoprotein-sorting protein
MMQKRTAVFRCDLEVDRIKMHNQENIFYATVLAAILVSCSASKTDHDGLKSIPVKDLKERINSNSKFIETFAASGSISIETPEESNSGSIEVRIKTPDSIFIRIEGPFGIDVAAALITGKDFIYYNAQENKAIMGPATEANIGAILRIKMNFNELLSSLTGTFLFTEETGDTAEAGAENNNYVIPATINTGNSKYYVDPDTYMINRYSVTDETGRKILDVAYSRFRIVNSMTLPDQIIIKKPDKHQTIWINYDTKEVNGKGLSFKIKIPKSAKVIKWGE